MNYSDMYRMMELYLPGSCAFSMEEKFMIKNSFPHMKPKTQTAILNALEKEHRSHAHSLKTLSTHSR